jgi:hypothetical protein
MSTKSTAVSFQLRDMDGNAIGSPTASRGTSNGDDMIRNVLPGEYYIEASRSGYISGNTMPFSVTGTRVVLRNAASSNYMDLVATGSGQTLAGTVYDSFSGKSLDGVKIQNLPLSTSYGAGVPIFSSAAGTFSYLTVNSARYITFNREGYEPARIYRASGAASGLRIELKRLPVTSLRIDATATVSVQRGGTYSFEALINEGPLDEFIVWSVNNPLYAKVDGGNVTILNKTGTAILTASDPVSNHSHSIILRIT